MNKFLLQRNHTVSWYTLKRDDAIAGVKSYLLKRNGVKNIRISSCTPAQLEGDKGYNLQVSYQEDLDETFNFPRNLDKVIFLDIDSEILPYGVEQLARETQAGIVITTPSLKDEFYDEGYPFPLKLANLIENANKKGIQIVGITPSISRMQARGSLLSNMMEYSIKEYLEDHPSIKKFIVINGETMQSFPFNTFIGKDISFEDEKKAKDILNGTSLTMRSQYITIDNLKTLEDSSYVYFNTNILIYLLSEYNREKEHNPEDEHFNQCLALISNYLNELKILEYYGYISSNSSYYPIKVLDAKMLLLFYEDKSSDLSPTTLKYCSKAPSYISQMEELKTNYQHHMNSKKKEKQKRRELKIRKEQGYIT